MEKRWIIIKSAIIAALITGVVFDQWHKYKFRGLLTGGCGVYVFVKYKYPDSDMWTTTQRIGPFKSEMFAKRVAADIRESDNLQDSTQIEIVEDCPQY